MCRVYGELNICILAVTITNNFQQDQQVIITPVGTKYSTKIYVWTSLTNNNYVFI